VADKKPKKPKTVKDRQKDKGHKVTGFDWKEGLQWFIKNAPKDKKSKD
jgi:hypothetical protein